jgi:hypothetical protein
VLGLRSSSSKSTEAGGYDGTSSYRPMAIVEDLTDEQFDELCRQFKPMSLPRRFEPPAPAVEARTILEITFENGFPEFSDGTSHYDVVADDAYSDDSDSEIEADDSDIAVDGLFQALFPYHI